MNQNMTTEPTKLWNRQYILVLLLNTLNADSDLMINAGGKDKVQKIIEHAANGDESYDDIMAEWNAAWTQAQEDNGVEITEE